jgi:transcriptional regulator with XRE-family HTH domain
MGMTKRKRARALAGGSSAQRQLRQVRLLSELREFRGLSQQELAARMCVSQSAVSKLERSANPSFAALSEYIAALDGELRVEVRFTNGTVEWLGPDEPPESR